jgi:uncharacterized membrane protein
VSESWEKSLERWLSAGLLDSGTAAKIRAFEASHGSSARLRWPVLLALALGGLLLCAGILLFVAAHWDEWSPSQRFSLVLLLVALFPIAGARTAERFHALSTTCYAIGTICTGAGIFLTAQIFNLQEHWPNGILLWTIGALAGWLVLRDWSQSALLAVLAPAWLASDWLVRTQRFTNNPRLAVEGLLLLALTYFSARTQDRDSPVRWALVWIGGISLLPLAAFVMGEPYMAWYGQQQLPASWRVLGWMIAISAPLVLAVVLRGRASWINGVAALWVLVLGTMHGGSRATGDSLLIYIWNSLGPYIWYGLGACGLIAWGLLERRRERINLGVAGFAITVIVFYFSDVMDKLGRSASLMGMGILLIFGGWILERTRRRLVARIQESGA